MKARALLLLPTGLGVACATQPPPQAAVVDVREAQASTRPERAPEPAPVQGSFPAGPGVKLVKDDLEDAKGLLDYREPYETRLAKVRARLGVDGEPIRTGIAFRGVGPKNVSGPFSCFELAVEKTSGYTRVLEIDRRLCGLPYRDDATKPYTGPGPRVTVARLRKIVEELKATPNADVEGMARARLGEPDDPARLTWFGIGGRTDEAPIGCHALQVDGRIVQRELLACGIAWPPPKEAFVRDEAIASPVASTADDDCAAKCAATDVCIARRRTERQTTIFVRGDDLFAFRLDGRPARIDVSVACEPIPAGCAPPATLACIQSGGATPRPGGPPPSQTTRCATPDEDVTSLAWNRAPSGRFTLTCNTRSKR